MTKPVTTLFEKFRAGDHSALNALTPALYNELHRIALRRRGALEMRYFGEMTAAMNMSVHIVRHDLRFAQAWLRRRLTQPKT